MKAVMGRREALRVLGVGALALACRRAPELPAPEAVALGRDECAWCRMIIDDARLPAEFARAGGRVEKFGEPGCLLAWLAEHPGAAGAAFVTVESGAWIPAGDAHYAVGASRTPMRFDVTAHRAAPSGGSPATWTALVRKGAPDVRND